MEMVPKDTSQTVANHLVRYLEHRQVDHIFGLCGHTNIAVLSALEESDIRFINVRHEQIAAHAADGFARVTGKASVLLSHLSPGLTNAATGVANAALDCIPMVVIAGDVPSYYYGKHPHQEVNLHADASQYEIYRPFVKRAWRVDNADLLPEILHKAFTLAQSGQPGPVLVNVPMDIFSAKTDPALWARQHQNALDLSKPTIDEDLADEIVERLSAAKSPLLYVGGGIALARAYEELEEFVDLMQIPLAHSLMGKGVLRDDHPLVLGMSGFWGMEFTNQHTLNADWILGLGTRFKEADSSSWYPEYTFNIDGKNTKLIHIDIEPQEIGRNYPTEIGAVADLKPALAALVRAAKRKFPKGKDQASIAETIQSERDRFKAKNQGMQRSDAFPMMPERILADLRKVMPKDAILTSDVGWNKNGVAQQFDILTPGSILIPGGFATMGFGPPAAIGAKLAAKDKVVISLVGDGGFGQNPAVLATAAEDNIPIIWLIMNNNAFGTIAGLQKANYGTTHGTVFKKAEKPSEQTPNYAQIANAYGCVGVRINSADELAPALEKAIASKRPTVIDVAMINNPTPTSGHWNILDIYSPEGLAGHASTD